ncbi:MAG: pantoate--beta-alanine ligase [Pseudomonadota bacterium]
MDGDSLLEAAARAPSALRAQVRRWRADGLRVALTPTMGALHEGHLSLLTLARAQADRVVASLFVNPTQFGPGEDFDAYPRDTPSDAALLAQAGCDLLYLPNPGAMYPPGFATEVQVTGLTERLCGAARPGHFDGVAQVVTKLLNQAEANVAVFGEKDWQQLAVIRRLAADLDIPTQILGAPTLREPDGLALSSRNRYLTQTERAAAPTLHAALQEAAAALRAGAAAEAACAAARARIEAAGFAQVDYVEALDGRSLGALGDLAAGRVFGAARLGKARLIDNIAISPQAATPPRASDGGGRG